jgi:hypothetical protein
MPPDSVWSERAVRWDDRTVELLAKGLLRIHPTRPGQGTIPDRVYVESRTTVAIEETPMYPSGVPGHELMGGFVTYQEALLEFPQPESSKLVYPSSAMPLKRFTEIEAVELGRPLEQHEQEQLNGMNIE